MLDLGCGDGTTAIPEAQLGADVLGVDISANLVAAGNARAQALGLTNVQFQEGDASDLGGLGGRIVMGNWIPNDPTLVAQILKISASYSPPPPEGFVSPMKWGVEEDVVERFTAAGVPEDRISFQRSTYTFDYNGSPPELVAEFKDYYGPTMSAFAAAAADGREADLQAALEELLTAQNTSDDGTSVPATFLRVTVER